jgi:hypothetical protein
VQTSERDLHVDYKHDLATHSCLTPNCSFKSLDDRRPCQTSNDTLLVDLQLQVFVSGYIVPHKDGRGRLQPARAWPEYHGRPCYSDISVAGADDKTWYGHALLFFRAGKRDSEWDEKAHKRFAVIKWMDLLFLRWYKRTGHRDAVTCDIYEWERMAGRSEGPRLSVEPLSSVISVEQLVPKTTGTRDKEMFYLNKYYR